MFLLDTERGDIVRNKLKEIRLKKNMTHKEIADKADISRAYYTNIELGKKDPSFQVVRRIKNVLEYYDDDIFLDKNVPKENNNIIN